MLAGMRRPSLDQPSLPAFSAFSRNAAELWPITNLPLLGWLLLALMPKWKWTKHVSLLLALLLALVYVGCVLSVFFKETEDRPPDFSTLAGVVSLFSDANGNTDPNAVFVGWLHYLVFDLLVGRGIVLDAQSRGVSTTQHVLMVVPCLFLTLMLGPLGFVSYVTLVRLGLLDGVRPKLD